MAKGDAMVETSVETPVQPTQPVRTPVRTPVQTPAPAGPKSGRRPRRYTTPAILRLLAALVVAADADLEQAAARAGSDGAAARQVRDALDALAAYEAPAAQVMFADAAHADRAAGQAPAAEVALFDQATDLMRTRVLPAARAVVDDNTSALEHVTAINQGAFDARITAGLGGLAGWPWVPLGLALGVAALSLGGLRRRFAEYRCAPVTAPAAPRRPPPSRRSARTSRSSAARRAPRPPARAASCRRAWTTGRWCSP